MGLLDGRVAVVTGSGRGIGREFALCMAREGASVVVNDVGVGLDGRGTAEDPAAQVCKDVEAAGGRAAPNYDSVSDFEAAGRIVQTALDEFGRLDILVNNAAFQMTHDSIEEFSTEEFDRTFKTNVYAMFWLCRAALPRMESGGVIINTASIQAYDPSPNLLAYAPTKGAIVNFTKALSQMAMEKGVRVNAVAPGPVWTPLIPSTMPEEKFKKFGQETSFERAAQPVEIAPVFVFLASNEARFVTGEVYGVTGGKSPY